MSKAETYAQLVAVRKACHLCSGVANPADVEAGRFDSEQIGIWSLWQGNLNAALMVVGQDWGDTSCFVRNEGREPLGNPTNEALAELLRIAGVSIGEPTGTNGRDVAFFTNAVLCLKSTGGLQGQVRQDWFAKCAPFLRRQIELVKPAVVVGLGERAYRSILDSFGLSYRAFRKEVDSAVGQLLPNGTRAFARYHCGARIQNTHRPMSVQREDWRRLRPFLAASR